MQAANNSTRRVKKGLSGLENSTPPQAYGLNAELELFLNANASEAYKRPWHRLERGKRRRFRKLRDLYIIKMRKVVFSRVLLIKSWEPLFVGKRGTHNKI